MICDGFFCDKYSMFGDMYCFETVLLCDMYRSKTYHFMTYCYVTHSLCDVPLSGCSLSTALQPLNGPLASIAGTRMKRTHLALSSYMEDIPLFPHPPSGERDGRGRRGEGEPVLTVHRILYCTNRRLQPVNKPFLVRYRTGAYPHSGV
jgi:hypothetical protein